MKAASYSTFLCPRQATPLLERGVRLSLVMPRSTCGPIIRFACIIGADYDAAIVLTATDEDMLRAQNVQGLSSRERADFFSALCGAKLVGFLVAVHFRAAFGAVPCNPLERVPARLDSEPAPDPESESDEDDGDEPGADANNRSASGRSGRFSSFAPLVSNPTFRTAVGGDAVRAHHTFAIAATHAYTPHGMEHMLIVYVGGGGARAMQRKRSDGGVWRLAGDDEGNGKPRAFVELPGRRFNYAKRPQNVRELRTALRGRSAKSIVQAPPLPLAMAESRVVLMGFLSHYGLVPSPREVLSVPDSNARTERARWRRGLPDGVNVDGAYITAVRTWGVFARPHVKCGA